MASRTPMSEEFAVERDRLVRRVVPRRGRAYEHRCSLEVYTEVAHRVDEAGDLGVTIEEVATAGDLPHSQVATALAFMKERGCILPVHGRRHVAASAAAFEDAMIEWHALREKGPED